MKKFLLMAAFAASFGFGQAQSAFPALDVFEQSYTPESVDIAPFTSWASEHTVAEYYSNLGFGPDWQIVGYGDNRYAGSVSTFTEKTLQADAGLVSTKITLPEEGGILSFTVGNVNPQYTNATNPFYIYVSTEGNQKENFTDENLLTNYRLKAHSSLTGPAFTTYNVSLKDYAGKEVYIAFVNRAFNAGMLLFNDMKIRKYLAEINMTTPVLYTAAGEYPVGCSLKLMTPISCKGFTAELIIDGQVYSTYSSTRELSTSYNTYTVAFPDKVNLKMNESIDYTVRVTPNYEGAEAIEMSSSLACRKGFPRVVVEEEGTGVGCGYCPFGSAWMAYMSDKYPDNFIGIAVHGGGYASGVMTAPNYSNQYLSYYNTAGSYPFAMLSRSVKTYPNYINDVESSYEKLMAENVALDLIIEHTYYYPADNKISVQFRPFTCFDTKSANYNAAVVLVADDLSGAATNAAWAQSNYYSGYSDATVKQFGVTDSNLEEARPYFEVYTKSPKTIYGCKFDHVAMGAWPDWRGAECPLNNEMTIANPESYAITFDVPMQTATDGFGVQDMTKTAVVVLIFDGKTGEIVTAKKMKYADFTQLSGVDSVNASASMSAVRSGDAVSVKAQPGTLVELYTADGRRLASRTLSAETETISPAGHKGLVIVRMNKGNDSYFNKIMF